MSYLEKMFSLAGKVAIVTGAARGNGKAIAEGLLRAGAKVYMVDILEELSVVCLKFKKENLEAEYEILDLSNFKKLKPFIDKVYSENKRIDILVNNAGVSYSDDILNYPDEMWEKTYNVNLKAPYQLSKLASLYMIKGGGGSIINITSLNSELAFPNNPAYVASKGALKQMTKSFALDLGKFNIRCNNIGPGYMKTEMNKLSWKDLKKRKARSDKTVLGRWGDPQDLAGLTVFLSSNSSSYITGQDLYVDGGWLIKGI
jgi:NAD(P)-dependent dehydrogenase (short-subunit alcohol dehydrogenase family)